ncbi:unnamed protein product [Closterium sp. Yama58-4]|nr:unnamed protein product [Closterium sp. Yama58-4]
MQREYSPAGPLHSQDDAAVGAARLRQVNAAEDCGKEGGEGAVRAGLGHVHGRPGSEFVVPRSVALVAQTDSHMGKMTVQETLQFSARLQGPGPHMAGEHAERNIRRREEARYHRRSTPGISSRLDSATAYQIIRFLRSLTHLTNTTTLISLLQPAPETFERFDDVMLMSEGQIVYHGPREEVLGFLKEMGFAPPARKGVVDFLQEVRFPRAASHLLLNTLEGNSHVSPKVPRVGPDSSQY